MRFSSYAQQRRYIAPRTLILIAGIEMAGATTYEPLEKLEAGRILRTVRLVQGYRLPYRLLET
jgi:hypothetical protein